MNKHYNIGKNNGRFGENKYNINKQFLTKEYNKKEKSMLKIAKIYGCSATTIRDKLLKYNISIREPNETKRGKKRPDISKKLKGKPNLKVKGKNHGGYNPERHKKHYCIEEECNNEISYRNWKYGTKRCQSCYKKERLKNPENNPMYGIHRFGKDAPCYINGLSKLPYPLEFNSVLKESIRKRDDYKCQKCGIKQEDNIIGNKQQKLTIHHIDYDKKNLSPNNLIALCRGCNCTVNGNRDYWFAYFTYIMDDNNAKSR